MLDRGQARMTIGCRDRGWMHRLGEVLPNLFNRRLGLHALNAHGIEVAHHLFDNLNWISNVDHKRAVANKHLGLAPERRGVFGPFWPPAASTAHYFPRPFQWT